MVLNIPLLAPTTRGTFVCHDGHGQESQVNYMFQLKLYHDQNYSLVFIGGHNFLSNGAIRDPKGLANHLQL